MLLCGPILYISDYRRRAVFGRDPASWRPVWVCIWRPGQVWLTETNHLWKTLLKGSIWISQGHSLLEIYLSMCHGMLWNLLYLWLTLLHQALVTKSPRTWQLSPTTLGIRGLCSWRPQRRIECSKRRCRLRDVKRVIASCRNDIMIPYKRSHPVGNAVLWLPTANWTVSHLCPTVCSPGTIPEALTVSL